MRVLLPITLSMLVTTQTHAFMIEVANTFQDYPIGGDAIYEYIATESDKKIIEKHVSKIATLNGRGQPISAKHGYVTLFTIPHNQPEKITITSFYPKIPKMQYFANCLPGGKPITIKDPNQYKAIRFTVSKDVEKIGYLKCSHQLIKKPTDHAGGMPQIIQHQ